jgi:cytochrome c oxidase assembly protein subunit 15
MNSPSEKRFLTTNLITIITLFAVILAGGIVRSSGSGMGCPDWPKCFDQYIPPSHISQLPVDYKVTYVARRVAKNERFAKTLEALGYTKMAYRIRNDQSILQPEEFNAIKTWTEYLNRLVGVLCGLAMFGCLVFSVIYLKSRKRIFFLSLLNVLLIVFQAWLGSLVVSTNLLAWVVTVHMLVALVIVAISIYTYYMASFQSSSLERSDFVNMSPTPKERLGIRLLAVVVVLLTTVQIALGTEVREQIDAIASFMNQLNRSEWVSKVGFNFNLHRDIALLVVVVNGLLFWLIRRQYSSTSPQFKYGVYIVGMLILQVLVGLTLSYCALPPVAQAMHILLASVLFGGQFYLVLLLGSKKILNI